MEITKFEHACLTVEKEGKTIVIDPGDFTTDFIMPADVVAIIITHEHGDHHSDKHIAAIAEANPEVLIIGPEDATKKLKNYKTHTVANGEYLELEGFNIDFYGGKHKVIHPKMPKAQNIGVLIDNQLYYPGDSFSVPNKSVDILALPVSAPWLKLSEAIDFMQTIGANLTFPTHDALLSEAGKSVTDKIVGEFAKAAGTIYRRIDNESITLE